MDSIVDPSADALWNSVATLVSTDGVEEKRPRTEEEWQAVRHNAVALVEATNLLLMRPRAIARPGVKSENPGIELEPGQIEQIVRADPEAFTRLAHGLHDAAARALQAIDAKDAAGLSDSGETIDVACENCHRKYWYPDQPTAPSPPAAR